MDEKPYGSVLKGRELHMRDFDLIDFLLLDDILHHHDSRPVPDQGHGCCGTCLLWFVLMVGSGVWLITELVRVIIR